MNQLQKRFYAILMSVLLLVNPVWVYSEELSLNFRNVDIRQIIESVGELTGKNFLIDPRVKGKVTIIANDTVPEESLYDVLLSILVMHNFRALDGPNDLIRIVPANLGSRYSQEKIREDLITEIITINHLNIGQMMPIIKPLLTPPGQAIAHKVTNKVILTDVRASIERVKGILARIDVASLANFEIINLRHSDAAEIHKIVQKINNKHLKHLLQIVADREANRIIISGPLNARIGVRALIAELDTPDVTSGTTSSIRIIPLRYAKATDMVETLKSLFSSTGFLDSLGGEGIYEVVDKKAAADKKKDKADKPKEGEDKAEPEQKTVTGKGRKTGRNYTIQADEGTNALVIGGPPKIIAAVLHVVSKLDVPRPQVLIEAIIADISDSQMADINTSLTGQRDGLAAEGGDVPVINSDTARGLAADWASRGAIVGQLVADSKYSLRFMISAIREDSNSNILSTPSILTMNNEEALIDVSDGRYVQTGSTSGNNSTTAAFRKEDFGTRLKVTPQITEGNAVRLDIEQETEDITSEASETAAANTSAAYPQTTKRLLNTSVLVNDGDILVLGGLIQNTRSEKETRVPLLSKIPVLGHLFKDRESDNESQTLMIFIRPTILRTPEDSRDFSRERYADLRMEQLLYGQQIDSLLPDDVVEGQAILPEIKDDERRSASRHQTPCPGEIKIS